MARIDPSTQPDPSEAIPLESCPACGSHDFLIEEHPEIVFRCLGCATGWRYQLGYVWAVEAPSAEMPNSIPG